MTDSISRWLSIKDSVSRRSTIKDSFKWKPLPFWVLPLTAGFLCHALRNGYMPNIVCGDILFMFLFEWQQKIVTKRENRSLGHNHRASGPLICLSVYFTSFVVSSVCMALVHSEIRVPFSPHLQINFRWNCVQKRWCCVSVSQNFWWAPHRICVSIAVERVPR